MTGSLLIVTHFYPPGAMVAARRPGALAKELGRLGYEITVVTSAAWGDGPAPGRVTRTPDLMASRINWRRANLRSWTGEAEADEYDGSASIAARIVVPDVALLTWLPFALTAALRVARERPIDCVITTSGPESAHLVGLLLRRNGPAWLADFRDGWGFESLHSWPTRGQDALDRRLERLVVESADAVTAVSEPIAADLRERRGVAAETVSNGYDAEHVPPRTGSDPHLNSDRCSLVHTGRMASSQRSPRPLLEGLRLLGERAPELAARLELVFAGPLTPEERALLEAPEVRESVVLTGNLPHERALRLQREADGLVLLTAGDRRGEATGKLFEYLAAERPIVVLGDRTEAARIVRDARAGEAVPADDPPAIAAGLERLARGELSTTQGGREQYSYERLARRFAELVEAARERRKTSE